MATVWQSHTAARDEAVTLSALASVRAVFDGAQGEVRREAALLARDPAIIAGALRRDWASLARGASPRMIALTLERFADLLVVLDGAGAPIVQVPATLPVALPAFGHPAEPVARLGVVGDSVYVLGLAPLPVGTVVVGRRLESLEHALGRLPSRAAVVVVGGDRALASTRPGLPGAGWAAATRAGATALLGETWLVRPLDAASGVWALVPDDGRTAAERRFWYWWAVSLLAVAGGVLASALARRGRRPRGDGPASDDGRRRQLEALSAVAQAMGSGENLALTAQRTLDVVCRIARIEVAGVFRVDSTAQTLTLLAHRGLAPAEAARMRVRPLASSHVGEAVRTGRHVVTDLRHSQMLPPEVRAQARAGGHHTQLALPIAVNGRTWGVLALISRAPRPWAPGELTLLQAVAHQVGLAVARAALVSEAREKSRRLETLTRLAQTLTATLSLDEIFQRLAGAAVELFDSSVARLWLVDEDGAHVSLAAAAGTASSVEGIRRFRVGEGLVGAALTTKRPVTVADVLGDPRTKNTERIRAEGTVSVAIVPLLLGERVLGALSIGLREAHAYTAEEVSVLGSLALHAVNAIHNARLFVEERTRRSYLAALFEINTKIEGLAPTETLLASIAEEAARLLSVDNAGFRLLDGDELVLAGLAGTAAETMVRPRLKVGESLSGQVVASGRPLNCELADVPDVVHEHLAASRRLGYTTFLGVPLRVGERAVGVLSFRGRRPFTRRDQELAEAFAGQAAIALEHARLYRETERQAERMTALAGLGRLLSETLDFDRVAQRVADSVCTLLRARSSCLYRLDPATGGLAAVTVSGGAGASFHWSPALAPGTGIAGLAVSERRAVATDDALADPRITYAEDVRARVAGETHRALLAVPLLGQDRLLGALVVSDRAGRRFDEPETGLAQAFADQAALALENARLYHEARAHADRLAALEEVNRLVSSSLKVEEVLHNIAAAVARFFDAPSVTVWVLDEAARRLTRSLVYGPPETAAQLRSELALGEGVLGWVALHREPVLWVDVETDPRVVDGPHLAREGLRFITGYPIALGERVLGAFAVHRATPTPITPETASLLGSLAAQAAVALDNARLYGATERRLEETRALLEVVEILSSTLDSKRLLQRATMKIAQVCRVDRCSLMLWEDGRVRPLMAQFADGRRAPRQWAAFQAAVARPIFDVPANVLARDTRRPVVVNDASQDARVPGEWIETFGLKSYLVVPMLRQQQVIGVMTLDYGERPTAFEPWQVDLAMTIAGELALSLENTRLYAEAQERLRETTTLLAVGEILSRPGPTVERLREVAREVARASGADMVGAYLLDAKREALVPLGGYHVPRELLEGFLARPIVLARNPELLPAWRAGRATWSADPHTDTRFDRDWIGALPPLSVLFASATAHGDPIGALFVVWWRAGRRFQPAEIRLVEGVAAQVGLAMENAELARQTQQKLGETEMLLSVSRALSSTLDLEALLRHFLRTVTQALGADSAGVWLRAGDGEWLEPVAGYHIPRERLPALREVRLSLERDAFYAEAARTRRPVASSHVEADPRGPAIMRDVMPHRSQLFVPIVVKDRVIGGFGLIWREHEREFADGEVALMEAIANQAGVAIENARLFEENRRQVEELSVLHALSRAVTGQLDRAALVEAIHAQVARVLDVGNMLVVLHDEERRELEVVLRLVDGARDTQAPLRFPDRAVGLVSVVLATGCLIRTDDYEAECARHGVEPVRASTTLRRWLGVPMRAGDRPIGVLVLRGGARAFTEADERLLTNIAHLAALALRSARLFDERARAYGELTAAQDQLVRTEKLRALGEMASGVAHDFNNLLASILGRAQLVFQRTESPQLRQWLKVIERSALDGAATVRRLQEFTRIRRDQPFVAVDLNDVVRDALEITQSRWRQEPLSRGVTVELRTAFGEPPRVAGDPAELREALTNLILNAVDAMPQGGVLALTTGSKDGGAVVTVGDTGVGIPDAVLAKIFDPFFTTKGPQGTGLGLSMTYAIVERHGAQIGVETAEGQGTTFRLTFPAGAPLPPALTAPPSAEPADGGASLRCLVVDDEPVVAAMLGDVLESGGHRVVVLGDGGEAIARFGAEPFDVVFTDLAMPRVSGWQVARAIKEMAPEVPIFLVTGFGVELSEEECRTHGVDLVLVKPLEIQTILDVVAQAGRRRPHPTRTEDDR